MQHRLDVGAIEELGSDLLLVDRAEKPDPLLSGDPHPDVPITDIYLPFRGGPTLARVGPRPPVPPARIEVNGLPEPPLRAGR